MLIHYLFQSQKNVEYRMYNLKKNERLRILLNIVFFSDGSCGYSRIKKRYNDNCLCSLFKNFDVGHDIVNKNVNLPQLR